ncbi:MAG TPA: hypothetical protein VIV60_17170 [Polyangiaceae bacterium]
MNGDLREAKADIGKLGGLHAFRSGDWVLRLVSLSLRAYYERANADYFKRKYPGHDDSAIAQRLIGVACKQASVVGTLAGAMISADEMLGFVTAGEMGVGIPANVAIALTAAAAESIQVFRIQLRLVAELFRLSCIPLDPNDPEDIFTILAFALGGSAAEEAGRLGMRIGGRAAGRAASKVITEEALRALQPIAANIGLRLQQRQLVKFAVPLASMAIGAAWNYAATRTIGQVAVRHIEQRQRGAACDSD